MDDTSQFRLQLEMSHVGLGNLDEEAVMVVFGSCHSRYLTAGLERDATRIVDTKGKLLYPAYFMTYLRVPAELPLASLALWDFVEIEVSVRRFGDTILDSSYALRRGDVRGSLAITMQANSLFIWDPSHYKTASRQVSAPKAGAVRELAAMSAPPTAIQESARVRSSGFDAGSGEWIAAEPFEYRLEANRDTSPGHPLIFGRFPLLMELSERAFLRELARGRLGEEVFQDMAILERKVFYYGNAFAGAELTLHTKGIIRPCRESLWSTNPRLQYLFRVRLDTEIYSRGELLAVSRAEKVLVHEIRNQSRIQDSMRLFGRLTQTLGD